MVYKFYNNVNEKRSEGKNMRSYVRESCDNLAGVQLVRSLSTWFSSFIYSFSSISVPSNVSFTFFKFLFKLDHVKYHFSNPTQTILKLLVKCEK